MAALRRVSFNDVAPFKSAAARDHVSVADTRETFWFFYEQDGEFIGFCGVMRTALGARVKGVWVQPDLRGRGHGTEMTKQLIKMATDELLFFRMEALAHNPAFYESLGWERIGRPMPNGAVWVARNY